MKTNPTQQSLIYSEELGQLVTAAEQPQPLRRQPTKRTGKITDYLLAKGWHRNPAEYADECGAETRISICSNPARWIDQRGVAMCAQHAYSAQLIEDRRG